MGKVGQESDFKSQLVAEICSISTRSNACVHHRNRGCQAKSPFIDWYLLIGVEEDARIDVIRKRYHKLALQLHPDKNNHPQAEIAFKLISEAYSCLSSSEQRRAFDMERWRNFCFECISTARSNSNSNATSAPTRSRSYRIFRGLKDLRDRFKEETRVIENCLKANAAASKKDKETTLFSPSSCLLRSNSHSGSQKESPIFNPSDYVFEGYPHVRSRIYKKPENLWYLQRGHVLNCERGRGKCDTPIFEVRSERGMFKSKSTCVRS